MVGPRRSLRALAVGVGVSTVVTALSWGAAPAARAEEPVPGPTVGGAAPVAAVVPDDDGSDTPLQVTIDQLTPGELPQRGPLVVRGTLTNRSDVPWSLVNLSPVFSSTPLTTTNELAAAVRSDPETVVGSRITDLGVIDTVQVLRPGQTRSYRIRVPQDYLPDAGAGVYWFSVHATGESTESPRDDFADGRARTLLPSVPSGTEASVPSALVVPLTRALEHSPDGSLADLVAWRDTLGDGGRLRSLVEFAAAAGDVPITWVVDPALLDAVGRLASGNPGRYLGPTDPDDPDPDATTTPGAEPTGNAGDGDDGGDDGTDPAPEPLDRLTATVADEATDWLGDLTDLMSDDQVLTLPYGNLDVPAALRRDPGLLDLARAQRGEVLDLMGIETTPVLTGPDGLIDAESIAVADDETTVLASDAMFSGRPPAVATVDGTRVVVTSSGAGAGGPGPTDPMGPVALRQRLLSEAAIRLLRADAQPIVTVLPDDAVLSSPEAFFDGLDVDWLDPDRLDDITAGAPAPLVSAVDVAYPETQSDQWLPQETFDAVDDLVASGDLLQGLLTRNTQVSGSVTEEALTGASYAAREDSFSARSAITRSTSWIEDHLDSVTITAPRGVTLSGASGSFAATISNDLDEPVTVSVRALSDGGIVIDPPEPFTLTPGSRTNIQLEVRATSSRVHNVTLQVTDSDGAMLGATDELPIRSAQVSDVIWLIMGTGAGLLFLAIVVRLVRRVRRARRGGDLEPDAG